MRALNGGGSAHPSAFVDEPCSVGSGTTLWHFVHVMAGAVIGADCVLGQGVFVAASVVLGDRVRVQNNVSLYDGVIVEDDVFIGPSAVFTNVKYPRSRFPRAAPHLQTRLCAGATIGANATIVCGATVGRNAFIGAGAVVARDVPDHALVTGVPARQTGWVGDHGHPLRAQSEGLLFECPATGELYRASEDGLALTRARPG